MTQSEVRRIRELNRDEIDSILSRNNVGRLGFARNNRLSLTPLSYVYDSGWIYGRTSVGYKIRELSPSAYNWWPVIFEVDEVESAWKWRSVVVHGGLYILNREDGDADRTKWERALRMVRRVAPDALTDHDAMSDRNILFRISAVDATGREAC